MASSLVRSVIHFFQQRLWQPLPAKLPIYQRFLYQLLRIFLLAATRFRRNRGALKASALTYFSTLSIVPAIVIGLGISEGFGFDIRRTISSFLEAQEEVLEELLYLADRLLHNTRGDWIAGVGLLVLFYTVLRLLHYVEDAFNAIWDIRTPRSFARKLTEYTTLLLTSPLLIIFASSLNVYLSAQLKSYSQEAQWISYVSPLIVSGLRTLPYISLWVLLSLLYIVMPNTRVRPLSAIWAGILSGTAFQLLQWIYIHLQVGVATYNVLYGSLAAVPLFLLWMYWSWAIVLFGAEWAFAYQNVAYYTLPPRSISAQEKQGIALLLTRWIAEAFHKAQPPMDLAALSRVSG